MLPRWNATVYNPSVIAANRVRRPASFYCEYSGLVIHPKISLRNNSEKDRDTWKELVKLIFTKALLLYHTHKNWRDELQSLNPYSRLPRRSRLRPHQHRKLRLYLLGKAPLRQQRLLPSPLRAIMIKMLLFMVPRVCSNCLEVFGQERQIKKQSRRMCLSERVC